jgi:hypothetical protein
MSGELDAVLERFARTGPEFDGGLSNHGPMAAEALVALGRDDAVGPWAEWYARKLAEPPTPRTPIDSADWREALGKIDRVADWSAFFARALDDAPWRAVLDLWVGRLAPGIAAGATHGVLRTAHAVRALERGETPQRLRELAGGLAYWAARYFELPARFDANVRRRPSDALALVPRRAATTPRGLITRGIAAVGDDEFAPVIGYVDDAGDPAAFIGDITRTFVRHYLAGARTDAIAFIHTVTAPSSLRTLAPLLSDDVRRATLRYAWQACAAIYAAYARNEPPAVPGHVAFDADELVEQAVRARDEHAIKFTEACLKEHALSGDPAFIVAAEDAVRRLAVRV